MRQNVAMTGEVSLTGKVRTVWRGVGSSLFTLFIFVAGLTSWWHQGEDHCCKSWFSTEGIRKEGVRREGMWREGMRREGMWREGVRREGMRREDVRREGMRREDVRREGMWKEGMWKEGVRKGDDRRRWYNLLGVCNMVTCLHGYNM